MILLLIYSCGKNNITSPQDTPPSTALELYTEYDYEDGYYRLQYPLNATSSYGRVHYNTEPITRVFWTSTDSFTFIYWGQEITEPVINYSTYSDADGEGQQLFYLYPQHIGDTLDLYGCIEECEKVSVIIE